MFILAKYTLSLGVKYIKWHLYTMEQNWYPVFIYLQFKTTVSQQLCE